MLDRLEQMETRYEDLGRQLADPQLVTDQQKYHKTAKAHRDLEARKTTGKVLLTM